MNCNQIKPGSWVSLSIEETEQEIIKPKIKGPVFVLSNESEGGRKCLFLDQKLNLLIWSENSTIELGIFGEVPGMQISQIKVVDFSEIKVGKIDIEFFNNAIMRAAGIREKYLQNKPEARNAFSW